MGNVLQRRLEGFVPLPPKAMARRQWKDPTEVSQLDTFIIDYALAQQRYAGPGLRLCSQAIPNPNPPVLCWRQLARDLSSATELGQNIRNQRNGIMTECPETLNYQFS